MGYTDKVKVKETRALYQLINRTKINDEQAKYYARNKDKIQQHKQERICCDVCNKEYSRNHAAQHRMSKYHQDKL